MFTFLFGWFVELFSCFFSCFFADDGGDIGEGFSSCFFADDGGDIGEGFSFCFFADDGVVTGKGFSSFICVVTVDSFSSVIKRRPSSFKPIDGKSLVDDSDGGGGIDCTSSMNFFLLIAPDFFFCCVAGDFADGFVPPDAQAPDAAAMKIIKI